ncbi:MAG: RnfABCDGE type electron transport complex subunit D [Candidatus Dormibacteraeota bacterium]|nr:RnfABCDGE type electron transport complex subunit D [Candidatus Dormibacteraeota bacterium]
MLDVRQLWRALHGVPQLLLVQPEQLNYDLAYALALLPLIIAGIVFFTQDALLLFAIAFLAGIVCLLALQLARLTFGLPAWVGFKATHPLVASILIACFFSPRTPAWIGALMVILFVAIDTVLWPQLRRVMIHPALIVFGVLYLVQLPLHVSYVNAFDGHRLDDPLLLWYKLQIVIDPVKLYVGNLPGPIGVTSAAAVLLGVTYLWYTRKISLGVVVGFLCGVAALAIAIRSDLGFQLASGPSLFLAGYIAADRRRLLLPERFTFAFGLAAGVATMILRWYGNGQQAAWQALLLVSAVVTLFLLVQDLLRRRTRWASRPAALRTLAVDSAELPDPHRLWAPVRTEVRQPVMATSPVSTSYSRGASASPVRSYDTQSDPQDIVRQMRIAATRGGLFAGGAQNPIILLATLLIINPLGLWLTWTERSLNRQTRLMLSAVSVLWYLGVAGFAFALTHR